MKIQLTRLSAALALLFTINHPLSTLAQGTAFSYQGQLLNNGSPASGTYNLSFSLFNASSGGSAVAGPVITNGVIVANGLFMVLIDFGPGVFTGAANWLEIGVEANGASSFTTLPTRQQLTPVPYAIYSENAGTAATAATANGVAGGSVTAAGIASGQVVKSLNGLSDAVTLSAGANVTITPSGNTLTIASTGGGGGGSGWSLTGDSGTIPGVNFLGTRDLEPLELWVNGGRALRLEPDTSGNLSPNLIGGSPGNSVGAGQIGSTIAGGGGIGYVNSANASYAAIGGGQQNSVQNSANYSTVSGGFNNTIQSYDNYSSIGGGNGNTVQSDFYSQLNFNGFYGAIGGGSLNSISSNAPFSVIGGGRNNTVGGGVGGPGTFTGEYSFIGGGGSNTTSAAGATVGGGVYNTAAFLGSTVAGGWGNIAVGDYSAVVGGYSNVVNGFGSFVGGGQLNNASDLWSLVGGGLENYAGGYYAAVVGGLGNQATGTGAFVGGGGTDGLSAGSGANVAGGAAATIPGGWGNAAAGNYSFAAGHQAQAQHQGAFVWADSQNGAFASTANDQFSVRAQGGVRLVTGGAGVTVDGQPILTSLPSTDPPNNVIPVLGMVWIKPGSFIMGSPASDPDSYDSQGNSDERPQTFVTLTNGFWMGAHPVTQAEYQTLIGSNPSYFAGNPNNPVEQVSWDDANTYCNQLTVQETLAGRLPLGWVYRLPTEAEWEYCCRAGARTTRFCYGDDMSYAALGNYAWYFDNSGGTTHPVEQKLGNAWGLMDMHGNVWEWCQDRYGAYLGGSVTNPQGPATGLGRVFRGGSWASDAMHCRSARRNLYDPSVEENHIGFRVVLAPGLSE